MHQLLYILLILLSPEDFSYKFTCEHAKSPGGAEGRVDMLEEACWGWENFRTKKLAHEENGQRLTAPVASSPEFDCVLRGPGKEECANREKGISVRVRFILWFNPPFIVQGLGVDAWL